MLLALKHAIKFFLWKLGFVRYNQLRKIETKYKDLIEEIGYLYKKFLFRELPPLNESRIQLLSKLLGTPVSQGIYILNYLHKSLKLEGDICEFGIAQGVTSAFLASEIRKINKKIWLFDSFKGLSKPSEKDILINDDLNLGSMGAYEGAYAHPQYKVIKRLVAIGFPYSQVQIVPGFIEDTLNGGRSDLPDKVCFAYIDFDLYKPTLLTLEYLDNVLTCNGIIVVDDYEDFSAGVKTAVIEFIETNKDKYHLILPIRLPGSAGHFCIIQKCA